MRYELADYEWTTIKPMLLNKPRGVRRVNDRRVLNGIFWVLRSGAPWRDLPRRFGPYTTCYIEFVRPNQPRLPDQRGSVLLLSRTVTPSSAPAMMGRLGNGDGRRDVCSIRPMGHH
jgi:transposase